MCTCTNPCSPRFPSVLEWFHLLESAWPARGQISVHDLMTHSRKYAKLESLVRSHTTITISVTFFLPVTLYYDTDL